MTWGAPCTCGTATPVESVAASSSPPSCLCECGHPWKSRDRYRSRARDRVGQHAEAVDLLLADRAQPLERARSPGRDHGHPRGRSATKNLRDRQLLLLAVGTVAVFALAVATVVPPALQQREAVERIRALGGADTYDLELPPEWRQASSLHEIAWMLGGLSTAATFLILTTMAGRDSGIGSVYSLRPDERDPRDPSGSMLRTGGGETPLERVVWLLLTSMIRRRHAPWVTSGAVSHVDRGSRHCAGHPLSGRR